jgi:hypothetical protein
VGSIDGTDVVESQETAAKKVVALRIFSVEPPGEVEQQFLEDALEKIEISGSVDDENRSAARAWTGGLTSSKLHSYAGSAPFGLQKHSATRSVTDICKRRIQMRPRNNVKREILFEPRQIPITRRWHQ